MVQGDLSIAFRSELDRALLAVGKRAQVQKRPISAGHTSEVITVRADHSYVQL